MRGFKKRLLCFVQAVIVSMTMFAGLTLPVFAITNGTEVVQGDYTYKYRYYYNAKTNAWVYSSGILWGVKVNDPTKEYYEDIPDTIQDLRVTTVNYLFYGNTYIKKSPKFGKDISSFDHTFANSSVEEVTYPSSANTLSYSCSNAVNLTKVVFESRDASKRAYMDYAFSSCPNLVSVECETPITAATEGIDSAFQDCPLLKTVPDFAMDGPGGGWVSISNTFKNDISLETPAYITALNSTLTIRCYSIYEGCISLTGVLSKLTISSNSFVGTSLPLYIPSNSYTEDIKTNCPNVKPYYVSAYSEAKKVQNVKSSDGSDKDLGFLLSNWEFTLNETDESLVLYKYHGEKSDITAEDYPIANNTYPSTLSSTFAGNTSVKSVEIPSFITSLGSRALAGCTGLTSLTIPKSVTNIGTDAFKGLTCSVGVYDNTPAKAYCVANNVPYITLSEIAPTTVVINQKPTASVAVGDTFQMNAVVYPSNATDKSVTWDSLNPDVATIDATGKLTAVAPGVVDIMVSTVNGMTAQATVSVAPATTSISVTPNSVSTLIDGNVQLSVTKTPSDSVSTVTYTSENTGIATVSSSGLVTGVQLGDTNIVVKSGTATVSVPVSVTDSVPVTSIDLNDITIDRGTTITLNPTILPSDATDKSVTYSIEDSIIASLENNELTANELGTTTLTITSVSTPSITKTVNVTVVEPQPLSITLSANTAYTRSNVSIGVETTGNVDRIVLPNGNIVSANSLSYTVSTNGIYQFTAYSGSKYVTKSIEITCIDRILPSLIVSSTFSDEGTTYSVNSVDNDSGIDYVLLPDGSHVTELPVTYTRADSGDTTFAAVDKAGNINSKVYTRQNIVLTGGTTTTFIAYEGIPTEWTNQDAKLTFASYNPVDGSAMTIDSDVIDGSTATQTVKIAGSINTGEPKTSVVEVSTKASSNGTINLQVYDGLGGSESLPVTVEYIDKDMPIATHTASGGHIVVTATDDLSGVKSITNPDGDLSDEYDYQYNGTYRFIIEDIAGNILYYDVTTTDGDEPDAPIVPPETPDSGAVAQYTEANLEGTVYPVSTLDVTLPSTINFIIDKNRKFIGSNYTVVNHSASPVDISIKSISPKSDTHTEVVLPDKFPDWTKLDKIKTKSNIALMLDNHALAKENEFLGTVPANDTASFTLSGKYGHDWGTDPVQLKYNLVFSVDLS